MKILIAPDAFKDSLSAEAAAAAIGRGMSRAMPGVDVVELPLADGGEGTASILTSISDGRWITTTVKDPLLREVEAGYGISGDGKTAFIELAQASGIQLLNPGERNPLYTSTFGTGQLIMDARKNRVSHILLCIGSSSTNDCGMGMAEALGYRFLDRSGKTVAGKGENLGLVESIEAPSGLSLPACTVLCDVDNPLFGPEGAAFTYAPQKGADDKAVEQLDAGLRHFGKLLEQFFGREFSVIPGAGAAGGMGAGAMAFLNAKVQRGVEAVMDYAGIDAALADAGLVITGEGRIDRQTLRGKVVYGLVQRAGRRGVPVVALCGTLDAGPELIEEIGLHAAFSVLKAPVSLEEAIASAERNLEDLAYSIGKLLPATAGNTN